MTIFNTIKTTVGYLSTLFRKLSPFDLSGSSLPSIYNYLPINEQLCTSGQPTEKQFAAIRDAGFNTVINLAPHQAENSLPDEGATLKTLGISYIHIPVDFQNPTDEDFSNFTKAMRAHADAPLWVHCAANMRVSAFVYRYRCSELGEAREQARADIDKIWQPFGVWRRFLKDVYTP